MIHSSLNIQKTILPIVYYIITRIYTYYINGFNKFEIICLIYLGDEIAFAKKKHTNAKQHRSTVQVVHATTQSLSNCKSFIVSLTAYSLPFIE